MCAGGKNCPAGGGAFFCFGLQVQDWFCIVLRKGIIMDDIFDRLLILRSPGVGPVGYQKLVKQFGSVAAAADAVRGNLDLCDAVSREMDAAAKNSIHFVSDASEYYPVELQNVKNHPPVISVRGNIETLRRPMVGIVGTRHATAAGMRFVSEVAESFASHNVAVVSGMAMGTDTAAHRGALRAAGNTQTIAVLAGGVDYIWPAENESLYWEIVERGAVLSEMPVGFIPKGPNFVQRNRWVAALSDQVILSEADLKSGSMRTAEFAIDLNRRLWAVPSHPSDARSAGPNSLIARGVARLCSGVADFFGENKKIANRDDKNSKNTDDENLILDALGTIPISESVLADVVKKSVSEIKRNLVVLELRGLVQKQNGGYVRL